MFGEHADPSSSDAAREAWLVRYDAHNTAVREHFSACPDRLLVMNIADGDGWERLCSFLGMSVRRTPFPNKNSSPTRSMGSTR
jgi:hypothetical protein